MIPLLRVHGNFLLRGTSGVRDGMILIGLSGMVQTGMEMYDAA